MNQHSSPDYGPLKSVPGKLRIDWYRSSVDYETLQVLNSRSNWKGAWQAIGHLALFSATGALCYVLFKQQIWFGFILALFFHGTIGCFFGGIAVHELGHGTVFKTRWLNGAFIRVYSLLSWWNFHDYALSHTYHHRYTLHPEGDREVVLPRDPSLNMTYLLQLFTFNLFGGPHSGGFIPTLKGMVKTAFGHVGNTQNSGSDSGDWFKDLYTTHPTARGRAVNWARLVLLFHFGVLAFAITYQLWVLPLVLTLFSFIANWLKYFVSATMHTGLRSNVSDFRKCARTITLDPVTEFLYWRMNWHLEHHMYAAVPCYNLKKLHRAIPGDMPKPRALVSAWHEMRETKRRQKVDPTYEFDTPVPSAARDSGAVLDATLVASLGDLAPRELA